jgi:serine/threonine protein kinase
MPEALDVSAGKFAGITLSAQGLGRLQLTRLLHQNSETSIYACSQPGVVVKMFDLDCGKPDEVSYGPYLGYKVEVENWQDLQTMDDLRARVPAYYGSDIDYERKFGYIVMEYLDGQNLLAWCQTAAAEGFPGEWAADFRAALYETLEIVKLFHKHGIVLIDFKPDNVIRLPDGIVKFVDMGAFFTPRHSQEAENYVYSATPDYAELIIDTSSVQTGNPLKQGADIFSAGVALFEMATGNSRLGMADDCAEQMLKLPEIYLFRDSQIRDIWHGYPHLKPLLPSLQTQLKDRQILFSEFWHLLKGFLSTQVPNWETSAETEHRQILLETGANFISDQLPDALKWLGQPIAHATTLRSFRLPSIAELGAQLADPIRPEIQEDLAQHNGVFLKASEFESHADFSQPPNSWEVRINPATGHYAISARRLCAVELRQAALFIFLKETNRDESGRRYYQIATDLEADFKGDEPLTLQQLAHDGSAWVA